jgi:DNA-binding NtrC family response regulator
MGLMRQYPWPGNVRELQNVVERMVVIKGGGMVGPEHLPREVLGKPEEKVNLKPFSASSPAIPATAIAGDASSVMYPAEFGAIPEKGFKLTEYIENLENKIILKALAKTNNNKNQAAKLLGLNRTTLVERIKKRKIAPLNAPSQEL